MQTPTRPNPHRRSPFAVPLRLALALLALLLVGGLAGACDAGGSDPERAGEDTVMPMPEGGEEYLDEGERQLGTSEVEVRLFERTIEMPDSLPEGQTTFVITNTGNAPHNFEIEGRGLEAMLEQPLGPGETGTLTVDLTPGDYTIYCPVGNHREQGMEKTLRVTR